MVNEMAGKCKYHVATWRDLTLQSVKDRGHHWCLCTGRVLPSASAAEVCMICGSEEHPLLLLAASNPATVGVGSWSSTGGALLNSWSLTFSCSCPSS